MNNLGLLIFRVMVGGMLLFGHGLDKLMHFSSRAQIFPNVTGLGSTFTLAFAVFAEVFCSFAVILGFATRLAALPVMATMLVAAVFIHMNDPFQKKELALLFLSSFTLIFFTGAGSWSIDGIMNSNGFLRRR